MILVVNLNPSLDKIYTLPSLPYGEASRAVTVQNTAGGKGSHVAHVLRLLGEEVTTTGFLGGYIGQRIGDALRGWGVDERSVEIGEDTRACINIATDDGKQTEVLEPGPTITSSEQAAFRAHYVSLLPEADLVVASGSLPMGLGRDFYCDLIVEARAAEKRFLLDTSGDMLLEGMKARPYFIKPNREEVSSLLGRRVEGVEDAAEAVRGFLADGIELPAVSMGRLGSLAGYKGEVYHVQPPAVERVVNAVGSGDAYVAGLAAGLARDCDIEETLALACACGTANVLEAESGFVTIEQVEKIRKEVRVTKL